MPDGRAPDRPPVPGQVVGSAPERRLGGAPRTAMVRLLVGTAVLWVALGVVLVLAGAPWWGAVRLATGVAALVVTVGWRVLRLLHRQRRGPVG